MNKILVIIGAGASYGCASGVGALVRDPKLCPPLTKDLFKQSLIKDKYTADCPDFRSFIPELTMALREPDSNSSASLEMVLRRFQDKADKGYTTRHRQLNDLKKYLAHFFCDVSRNYLRSGCAYDTLCTYLQDTNRQAMFVSFNYDTLLEDSIHATYRIEYRGIEDYIQQNPVLIKPHGSWNWSYNQGKEEEIIVNKIRPRPLSYSSIGSQNEYQTGPLSHPALGLPISGKKYFVCPDSHLDTLSQFASQASELLVIGWSANEPHFNEIFSKMPNTCKVTVVSSTLDGGKRIFKRLKMLDRDPTIYSGGFSEYLKRVLSL